MLKILCIIIVFVSVFSFNELSAEVYMTKYGNQLLITPKEASVNDENIRKHYVKEYSNLLFDFEKDLAFYNSIQNKDSLSLNVVLLTSQLGKIFYRYPEEKKIAIDNLKSIIIHDIRKTLSYLEKWKGIDSLYSKTNFFDNYDESKKYVLFTDEGLINIKDCEIIYKKNKIIALETIPVLAYSDTGKWLIREDYPSGTCDPKGGSCDIMIWVTVVTKCVIQLYQSRSSLSNYPANYKYNKEAKAFERNIEIEVNSYKIRNIKSKKELFIKSWIQLE